MLSAFYRSRDWEKFTEFIRLSRTDEDGNLLCEHCGEPIVAKYDCICHHITQLTPDNVRDAEISLNPNNIMCVHSKCHNIIHSRFGSVWKRVYLVYGSPCSGKTTWVHSVAGAEDIILDIDSLWCAVSVAGETKPDRLKENVFALRDSLLGDIKRRRGKWRNAYVIMGAPMLMERKRFYEMYGAEPVFIDTPQDICMLRAEEKPGMWKGFVQEWFERYIPDDPPPGF